MFKNIALQIATVGQLRTQSAFCEHERRIVVVSKDPEIAKLGLRVVEVYPDTTDEHDNRTHTFKVEVAR